MQIHQAQREGYSVFAVLPAEDNPVPLGSNFLPHCQADDYFLTNPHLAFSSFGSASGPSQSGSRKRSSSPDSPDGGMREAQRRRITPAGSDEVHAQAQVEFEPHADPPVQEEEMIRRAIEASMAEAKERSQTPPTEEQTKPDPQPTPAPRPFQALEDELAAALENSHMQQGKAPEAFQEEEPDQSHGEADYTQDEASEDGSDDDEPTLDELRQRRLARFS